MELLWLCLAVAFGVIEAVTAQLVSVWFAGGAVCALIAGVLGANPVTQCIVFVVTSALILLLLRPMVKKLTKTEELKTNVDSFIGKTGIITKAVGSHGETGEAKVEGNVWTVKSDDSKPIEENSLVTVMGIEGVKLIVKEKEN